jgi:hypothetical protein
MTSKIYLAIIFSDYQEINLKRFMDHLNIKDETIIINGRFDDSRNKKNSCKFPKNAKIKNFSNKYIYLIYLSLLLIKYLFHNKKFIFGNPQGTLCNFLRIFIAGKNQIYVDDGSLSLDYDFNKLKKDCTVFTIYNIKLPTKINKIQHFPKHKIKKKKTCEKVLLVGNALIFNEILSKYKFINIMKILSKKNKVIYYYPHPRENEELSLLPKNFKILKRKKTIEKFIDDYKYNFKLIYAFGFSSSIIEISYYFKKENIKVFDINNWIDSKGKNFNRKKDFRLIYRYIRQLKIDIIKL